MAHPTLFQNGLSDTQPKWFNSPIHFHEGTIDQVRKFIPIFDKFPFGLIHPDFADSRINERLDMIIRMPLDNDNDYIPVGTVSKDYTLVQHTDVIKIVSNAFEHAKINLGDIHTELRISEYGERMNISCFLPEKYSFDPGDGHKMAMRFECYNSVDGSSRFHAMVGWYRFICSNGLIIGITQTDVSRRHIRDMQVEDIGDVLLSGINASEKEKENLVNWRRKEFQYGSFCKWVNTDLQKKWGFKAATRTYHIAVSGCDVSISGPYKNNSPTTIPVIKGYRVPGTPNRSNNLFDLSQILAWLAKERRDLQEQLEWREAIPILMKPFLN